MPAMDLEMGWIVENETFFIRVWKPPSRKRALKTLEGSREGKAQRG